MTKNSYPKTIDQLNKGVDLWYITLVKVIRFIKHQYLIFKESLFINKDCHKFKRRFLQKLCHFKCEIVNTKING